MNKPHSEENVRDLLVRREGELLNQIELIQAEIDELRHDLTPKESELIEVRRAKAALGMSLSPDDVQRPPVQPVNADVELHYQHVAHALRETPHEVMKIKDLLVVAMIEHFQVIGAAPADLKSQIKLSYGRDIDPGSIRPNLARLRDEGIVMRAIPPKWVLRPEAATVMTAIYFNGDLNRMAAALAWREENDVIHDTAELHHQIDDPVPQPPPAATLKKAKDWATGRS